MENNLLLHEGQTPEKLDQTFEKGGTFEKFASKESKKTSNLSNATRGQSWQIFMAGLIVGLATGYVLFHNQIAVAPEQGGENAFKTASATPLTVAEPTTTDLIEINTQMPGVVALVSRIVTDRPGWIAVHEMAEDALGNVLGAAYVPAGEFSNIQITLLRGLVDGQNYVAVLHDDNGDRQFDLKTDRPRQNANNKIISAPFPVVTYGSRN